MNTIDETPEAGTSPGALSVPMASTRTADSTTTMSSGKRRKRHIGSKQAIAQLAGMSSTSGGRRESVIPSMTTTSANMAGVQPTAEREHRDHNSEKVGRLLKHYSRLPASGFSSSTSSNSRGKKNKSKDGRGKDDRLERTPTAVANSGTDTSRTLQTQLQNFNLGSSNALISKNSVAKPTAAGQANLPSQQAIVGAGNNSPETGVKRSAALPGLNESKYSVPVRVFQDSEFDPSQFVRRELGESADYQVRDYLEKLRVTRDQIEKDMQRNLFNNYSQFVKISSEIATLEQEIGRTRNMMTELCTLVDGMRADGDHRADGSANLSAVSGVGKDLNLAAAIGIEDGTAGELPILRQQATGGTGLMSGGELLKLIGYEDSEIESGDGSEDGDLGEAMMERLMDLDVMLAHRQMDLAVSAIEELSRGLPLEELSSEVSSRSAEAYDILVHGIGSEFISRGKIVQSLRMLERLGYQEEAIREYLQARAKVTEKRISQALQQLMGSRGSSDIVAIVGQMCMIGFTIIRVSVETYRECFPSYAMASRIADWTRSQVDAIVKTFLQITKAKGIQRDSDIYRQAKQRMRSDGEQLREVGMDMDFMMADV
ncbi:Cullin repeat-like-containing domain protein [Lipomyces oligophaga]|uniref:Cullin repeat-like-containing domain protein n=1 Tax=Lipomyces oligophaga TaxID=45792 RepID=UPI0034CD6B6F